MTTKVKYHDKKYHDIEKLILRILFKIFLVIFAIMLIGGIILSTATYK